MKRIAALILALVTLGLTGTALAYDGEITFQGFRWGSSLEEVITRWTELALDSEDFLDEKTRAELAAYREQAGAEAFRGLLEERVVPAADSDVYLIVEADGGLCLRNPFYEDAPCILLLLPGPANVAGYPCDTMAMLFVYGVDESGACIPTETHLALIAAALRAANQAEAAEDLRNKLTRVYGESREDSGHAAQGSPYWTGADRTAVELFGGTSILVYADAGLCTDYIARHPAAPAVPARVEPTATPVPANNVDSGDISGL